MSAKISFGRLRSLVRYQSIVFLILTFAALNFHILTQNATTMPPHSVTFGITRQDEPALESLTPNETQRALSGYYTADPIGTSALYPYDRFALDSLARGEIPFWNPYTLTGLPFLAEYQWGIFYPPNWLRLMIPEGWWDLYSALHVLLLAFIVFLIARTAYFGYRNAIFAGVAVFGIGFILLYFPTHTLIVVAPWGAMLVLGIERLIKRKWDFAGLSFIAAGVYGLGTAGHPTLAIFWVIAFIVFLFARWVLDRDTAKALVPSLIVSLLAAFATAPNLVPFIGYILSNEGNVASKFNLPMFYTLRDLFMLLFPYVFGPVNSMQPPVLFTIVTTPGFLSLPPFVLFPAFVGGWFAIKLRNTQLIALMASAFVLILWAFGIPPLSWLSSLPLLSRLTFHYCLMIPSVVLCILAGYGYGIIAHRSHIQLRKVVFFFIALYLAAIFALVMFLWSLGLIQEFFSARRLLLQGLVPSVAFAILGPFLILLLMPYVDRRQVYKARTALLSSLLLMGFGLNIAAVYPTANAAGAIRLPLAAFALFVVVSFSLVTIMTLRKGSFLSLAACSVIAVIIMGGATMIANLIYPGLPERYNIVRTPKFIDILAHDRLNWRAYGMNGAVPLNNLVRFEISAVNNQNALVPAPLRNFISNYLDSSQGPTGFYGFSYAPGMDPSSEYLRNIRFWEYIGVRYVIVDAGYPLGTSDFWQDLGHELAASDSLEVVVVPQLSGKDLGLGLVQPVDCSEGAFSAVRIKLGTFGRVNPGSIVLTVTDPKGNLLANTSMDASQIVDAYFHLFSLGHEVCTDPSLKLNMSIHHKDGQPDSVVAAWRSGNRTVDILRVFSQPTPSSRPLHLVYADDETSIAVFEDPKTLPRAYFANRFELTSDWLAAQKLFAQQTDLRSTAFGEDNKNTCQSVSNAEDQQNRTEAVVKITALKSSSVSIMANVPSAGTLVLIDTFMPGWTALVDGKPEPVLRINGVFRGVCLDSPGVHNVTMQYRPPFWNLALFLAFVGFVGLIILFSLAWQVHRQSKIHHRNVGGRLMNP